MPFFLVRERVAAIEPIELLQIGLRVTFWHANKIISLFIWSAIILAFAFRFCNYNNNFIMEGLTADEKQQLIKGTGIVLLTQNGRSQKCTKTRNKRLPWSSQRAYCRSRRQPHTKSSCLGSTSTAKPSERRFTNINPWKSSFKVEWASR